MADEMAIAPLSPIALLWMLYIHKDREEVTECYTMCITIFQVSLIVH